MTDVRELTHELYADITRHDLDCFAVHLAEDLIEHEELADLSAGKRGVLAWFSQLVAAFPDLKFVPLEVLVDGDKVAARVQMTGTHQADFAGVPASGKSVDIELIDFFRFGDGVVAEHWGIAQELKMLQQLGAAPA